MQARLDLLTPALCCTATAPTRFGCCVRYTGSVNDAPPLAAELADLAERATIAFIGSAGTALKAAAAARM